MVAEIYWQILILHTMPCERRLMGNNFVFHIIIRRSALLTRKKHNQERSKNPENSNQYNNPSDMSIIETLRDYLNQKKSQETAKLKKKSYRKSFKNHGTIFQQIIQSNCSPAFLDELQLLYQPEVGIKILYNQSNLEFTIFSV